MRWAILLVLVLLASGCGADGRAAKAPMTGAATTSTSSKATCAEVRRGIDAFNSGDYQGTVDHFERAVPLARAAARAHRTRRSEQLLEAVTYYAELAPEDYLDAARSSPEFAKYKAITLHQCESDEGPRPSPSASGLPV